MTGNFCRLVNTVSRLLEPDERDAVLGDFAESGETGGQALCGLCGLILRRQTKLWKCWRPWLVLLSLVIPLAWLLSVAARLTASSSAVYLWSYLNNWDWTLLRYGSFWSILRDAAVAVSVQYTLLACWSWSAGLLLGSASRRTAPGNFLFFCVISLFGEVLAASRYLASWFVRPWSAQSDPVSALPVYKEILPVLVLIVLVVIPLAWAMRDAADLKWFHTPFRISLLFYSRTRNSWDDPPTTWAWLFSGCA